MGNLNSDIGLVWFLALQVGDAKKDHACWERPEDMDTPRSVFKIDANTPGSEVAAETAAALAAASLVFRRSDPTYSKVLVRRAIRVSKPLVQFLLIIIFNRPNCSQLNLKRVFCF